MFTRTSCSAVEYEAQVVVNVDFAILVVVRKKYYFNKYKI